jgi:hypothetical protein
MCRYSQRCSHAKQERQKKPSEKTESSLDAVRPSHMSVHLCMLEKTHAISKKKSCWNHSLKQKHQKQDRKGELSIALDEESGETSNTGKSHTGVELASGTGVG